VSALDLLVKNGKVVDGTGNPWKYADVGIDKGKIVEVGRIDPSIADNSIDASGLIVAPGFIDIHAHSNMSLLLDPRAMSHIMQGITTEVPDNCGFSAAPRRKGALNPGDIPLTEEQWKELGLEFDWETMAEYMHKMQKQGVALNIAPFVGHNTVRWLVMGDDFDRACTPSELEEMKALVDQAMRDGAWELTTGLEYELGKHAETSEVIELCKVVAEHGGIYTSHIRSLTMGWIDATKELVEISERAGIRGNHSHFSLFYPANGQQHDEICLIEEARARGIEITGDVCMMGLDTTDWPEKQRPSSIGDLASLLPDWALGGGVGKLLERLTNPEIWEKMKTRGDIRFNRRRDLWIPQKWNWLFVHDESLLRYFEKSIAEVSEMLGDDDPWETVFKLLHEAGQKALDVTMTVKTMEEEQVRDFAVWPLSNISTDTSAMAIDGPLDKLSRASRPHDFGTYPFVFAAYVKRDRVLTLEEAVRKCCGAAQTLGFKDMGLLREGMWADIVIFDFNRIADKGTFEDPAHYPEGIEYVLVSGIPALDKGKYTGKLPGRVLRHKSAK